MKDRYYFFFFFVIISTLLSAQEIDSIPISDSIIISDGIVVKAENNMMNSAALDPFFKKLRELERTKKGKINIVHIGDSHIQADFITDVIRDSLQKKFGNGGRGFVFPYSLMKTNGESDVMFSSNRVWESYRNIYPVIDNPVGLSGIALFTKNKNFVVEIKIKDTIDNFQIIQIITPENKNMFDLEIS